jgi:hypothetical protein
VRWLMPFETNSNSWRRKAVAILSFYVQLVLLSLGSDPTQLGGFTALRNIAVPWICDIRSALSNGLPR